ncbi:energy-coupling factor transporter transmembrane component T [Clostridium paraputrificum]|uniref:energy-coupling factor transporter transmembrane component T n=1 Tax=Clostridium paraputrificum TaxID=29363 RepID=UPI003D3548A3
MKDTFSTYHPIINFIYFIVVILFTMFFMHPIFLVISLIASIVYSIRLKGLRALKFNILYMIPTLIIVALINMLLNHQGATILLYINDNPITLESIVYGMASSVMFISVIIWFSCYNEIMTSDKFIYLFGRIIPSTSLIFSMVLRFVPKFKAQIKEISKGQRCIGRDVSEGNIFQRARNGVEIVSILVTWALENAIDTADSMKSRGYGLRGRTSFSLYHFDKRDKSVLVIILSLIGIIIFGSALGENSMIYYPQIKVGQVTTMSIIVYTAYFLLSILPIILDLLEEIRWRL